MSEEQARAVEQVRFQPVRLREGYDMGEVDEFLDRLSAALRADQPIGPLVAEARFTAVRLREGYDIGQVDRFLDDVVARQSGQVAGPRSPAPPPPPPPPPSTSSVPTIGSEPSVVQEQKGLFSRLFGR